MTESNTRKWWRTRIKAVMQEGVDIAEAATDIDTHIDGWLDDFMQTPELSLAELAEANANYKLAVVDDGDRAHLIMDPNADDYRRVVKMEGDRGIQ